MIVVLGPVPCQRCRQSVAWNGWEWRALSGHEHICMSEIERACYNSRAGSSSTRSDIVADDARLARPRSGVVARLEV